MIRPFGTLVSEPLVELFIYCSKSWRKIVTQDNLFITFATYYVSHIQQTSKTGNEQACKI
jgi:hypothetical protein